MIWPDLVVVDVEVLVPVVEDLTESVQFVVEPQSVGGTGRGGERDQVTVIIMEVFWLMIN